MKIKNILISTVLLSSVITADDMSIKKEGIGYIKQLGFELKSALGKQLKEDPSGVQALNFCANNADKITKEVNSKLPSHVLVRRTAIKLRNHKYNAYDNTDLKVMKAYEESIASRKFSPKDIKVVKVDGATRVYKPLITNGVCLKCHGSNVSSKLQTIIHAKYPNDKAVNFAAGSLRGVVVAQIEDK